ncbi:MAG: proline dehydrogenase family protein [Actinobacteria bacterium]|nr:proline dehydrogenase family protein [Actinomycetota bacterium]
MVVKAALVAASQSDALASAAGATPLTKSVARRFVAGDGVADAVSAAASLASSGLHCTIEHLGPPALDLAGAEKAATANLRLLEALDTADLIDRSELSIKLTDLGLELDGGEDTALRLAGKVAAAAESLGTLVTLDMENYESVEPTLRIFRQLRAEYPHTGIVLQSYLKRTEEDCREFANDGTRVRLVKGAFNESADVAFQSAQEIDLSYVRCLKLLMAGSGVTLIATHDPRLIEIASALAIKDSKPRGSYEFQLLYGVRTQEAKRLATTGDKVRVYVPFGEDWYPYLVRRMAEKPANLALLVRALTGR